MEARCYCSHSLVTGIKENNAEDLKKDVMLYIKMVQAEGICDGRPKHVSTPEHPWLVLKLKMEEHHHGGAVCYAPVKSVPHRVELDNKGGHTK